MVFRTIGKELKHSFGFSIVNILESSEEREREREYSRAIYLLNDLIKGYIDDLFIKHKRCPRTLITL